MKLKKAIRIFSECAEEGVYWIAVDEDKGIWVYWDTKPTQTKNGWHNSFGQNKFICNTYTGKKHWTKTLREFTV